MRRSQGNPGRGGSMSKGSEARKSTLCARSTRNSLSLKASEKLRECVRLRSLRHRVCEGFSAGRCNCGLSRHNLDLRMDSLGRGRVSN